MIASRRHENVRRARQYGCHRAQRLHVRGRNSFLFGSGSAVRFYRANTVTDLNDEGMGGVPALFKSFTQQAGLDYDVSLETRGGVGLDFHLENKIGVIGARGWDEVVMHGYSTLDAAKPRDAGKLIVTSKQMADILRARNPRVDLYLMATWSRAEAAALQQVAFDQLAAMGAVKPSAAVLPRTAVPQRCAARP